MEEFKSEKDLYLRLKPAFNVKLKLFRYENYSYIRNEDIWNYLRKSKWKNSYGLRLCDMANDIINVKAIDIDNYINGK